MRRTAAVGAALLLRPAPPPAAAQAGPAPPAPVAVADDAGALAVALEAGLEAGDAGALLALFAPDAQIKEGGAVLAAGPARVAAWVQDCLLPDVRLVPGTRRLGAAAVAGRCGTPWAATGGPAPPASGPPGTSPPARAPAPSPRRAAGSPR